MALFGNRPTGARLFWWDPLVIAATVALTVWLAPRVGHLAVLPALVVGHFLLFCNIARVRTRYELIWAACFLALVGGADALGQLHGGWIALAVAPVTVAVIWRTVRSPGYRGLGARPQKDSGPQQAV